MTNSKRPPAGEDRRGPEPKHRTALDGHESRSGPRHVPEPTPPEPLTLPGLDDTNVEAWTDRMHRDARAERDAVAEALAAAIEAASASWTADARRTIEQLAERGEPFTAEDVRRYVGDVPGPSQNALGGLVAQAARAGTIVAVGWTGSTRPEAHSRPLRVWRGR